MISLPLADFRHLSHIGNDAHTDSFGDLSFLKRGQSLMLQSSQSEQNLFLACNAPPKPPRLNLDEAQDPESPEWPTSRYSASQRKKKCSSMPLLDSEEGEGEVEVDEGMCSHRASVVPRVTSSYSPERGSLSSGRDGDSTLTCPEDTVLKEEEADSGFSFTLDLGPSILNDVLQVMEKLHH